MRTIDELYDLLMDQKRLIEKNNAILEAGNKARDERIVVLENKVEALQKKVAELRGADNAREQYARGWCVRVFGLHVGDEEERKLGKDRAAMKKSFDKIIKPILTEAKAKGDIETVPAWYNVLENGHKLKVRRGAADSQSKTTQPEPIILRFISKHMRNVVLRNKKDAIPKPSAAEVAEFGITKYRIAEDLTRQNFTLMQSLWASDKGSSAWSIDGKLQFIKVGETKVNMVSPGILSHKELLED